MHENTHHLIGTSVLLLIVYGCYLFFQLKSHTEIYNRPSPKVEKRRQRVTEGDASRGIAQIGKMTVGTMGGQHAQVQMQDPDDEPEQPQLTVFVALLTLVLSTALVAVCAEFMVSGFVSGGSTDAITDLDKPGRLDRRLDKDWKHSRDLCWLDPFAYCRQRGGACYCRHCCLQG